MKRRVFLIVLDSLGIGHAPDAAKFGDEGSNTLGTIIKSKEFHAPNLQALGLFNIDKVKGRESVVNPIGSFARLIEASQGKDTTIGHWEIAGIISEKPLPTYPNGFPKAVLDEFTARTGRQVLCNKPYSGTEVIEDYGKKHVESGALIVYTSADSVFQIAAHEEVVPLDTLYEYCKIARKMLTGEHGVGRVIARPFIGEEGNYQRTPHRHDYSLLPPSRTMMDVLDEHGYASKGVGKIYDIFAGQSIQTTVSIESNEDGMEKTLALQKENFKGLCFVNLVDFDMIYGHRNNIDGYAKAVAEFDKQFKVFKEQMRPEDIVMITADHGCDPGFPGTDHSRECVPLMIYGQDVKAGVQLGTRQSFADIAATILDIFDLSGPISGTSFWSEINEDKLKRGM